MSSLTTHTTPICPRVDAHTHVFHRGLAMAAGRRYTPDYDATLPALFSHLDAHHLDRAVLVQPSFLGTDNRYMLAVLAQAPERLRGIAMIEPDASDEEMAQLAAQGVAGVRFNLIGADMPALRSPEWRGSLARMAALGWHVELHRHACDLAPLIDAALDAGLRVVVDHYGRPNQALGLADPALDALMGFGASRRVWVKLSASYRCGPDPSGFERQAVPRFMDAFGTDRLLWGSDWPHTQWEGQAQVASSHDTLRAAVPAGPALDAVLGGTAAELYGFAKQVDFPAEHPAPI